MCFSNSNTFFCNLGMAVHFFSSSGVVDDGVAVAVVVVAVVDSALALVVDE